MRDLTLTLDRLVERAGQLYSLPAVAMKVLDLTNNPQVDTRALKDCIENDPALTSKVLRVVNSALFGLSREVSDLNQALALLGTKPLKLLVLGFSLPAGLFQNVAADVLTHYWRHTLIRAVAARELSESVWRMPGDDAFIAGLLQDLGMLLLIQELGEPYQRVIEKTYAEGLDLATIEVESMGFDHTMLTARLLAHWGLPDMLVETVQWRRLAAEDRKPLDPVLPQILHLAELLAQLLADKRNEALAELIDATRLLDKLNKVQLEAMVIGLQATVRELANVLSLQLPEGVDYRDILIQAHAQLSQVADSAASDLLAVRTNNRTGLENSQWLGEINQLAEAVAQATTHYTPNNPMPTPPLPAGDAVEVSRTTTKAMGMATDAMTATCESARTPSTPTTNNHLQAELEHQIAVAVAACRQARCAVSVVLVQLDHPEQFGSKFGDEALAELRDQLEQVCRTVNDRYTVCISRGDEGVALILPGCERRQAIELGNQIIAEARHLTPADVGPNQHRLSVSVGVATVSLPPKNFPANDLLAAADRCLYGSLTSGGGVVKSIEIY